MNKKQHVNIMIAILKEIPAGLAGLSFGIYLAGGDLALCTWLMASSAWIQIVISRDEIKDALQTTNVDLSADVVVEAAQSPYSSTYTVH